MNKKILCLDFDGVIHRYSTPWSSATEIPDVETDGFFEWAHRASSQFRLVIYSSRSKEPGGIEAMRAWLKRRHQEWTDWQYSADHLPLPEFEFAHEKPAAFLTIDDRGLTFSGSWEEFDLNRLCNFKPWNR